MHIPNGFLDAKTIVTTAAASACFLAYAVKKSKEALKQKYIPLIGVTAAFIFASQMVNFPIAGGTSGHFLGSAFAVIVAGPFGGALVMSLVVALQSLIFQDGGLLALGANILNMGIIGPLSAYFTYRSVLKLGKGIIIRNIAVFCAGLISVVLTSIAVTFELAASGITSLKITLPAMVGTHLIIGLIEGVLTVFALSVVTKLKPEILSPKQSIKPVLASIAILTLLVVILAVPYSSNFPDGLEKVALLKGFHLRQIPHSFQTIFSDYQIPYISGKIEAILAALIGITAVGFISYGGLLIVKDRG